MEQNQFPQSETQEDRFNVENLDDIFLLLQSKMDMNNGADLRLKEQQNICIQNQKVLHQQAIENQILVHQCMQLRPYLSKNVYRDLIYLFGSSYIPDDFLEDTNSQNLLDRDKKFQASKKKDLESAKKSFKDEILPKLEERIKNSCRTLRSTMYIAEGENTEDIINREEQITEMQNGSKSQQEKIISKMMPINKQIQVMERNIEKVKDLLSKTSSLKDELKYDIYELDVQIDDYIQKIGNEFIIDTLQSFQDKNVEILEEKLESLKIKKKIQLQEFQNQMSDGDTPRSMYEQVQKILDMRSKQLKEEKKDIELEIQKYSSLKSHEAAELEQMAKEYDVLMANKQILKNQILETKM